MLHFLQPIARFLNVGCVLSKGCRFRRSVENRPPANKLHPKNVPHTKRWDECFCLLISLAPYDLCTTLLSYISLVRLFKWWRQASANVSAQAAQWKRQSGLTIHTYNNKLRHVKIIRMLSKLIHMIVDIYTIYLYPNLLFNSIFHICYTSFEFESDFFF